MNDVRQTLLQKAAALTREGRVLEATRAIQEGLGLAKAAPTQAPAGRPGPAAPPRFKWLSPIGTRVRSRPPVDAPLPKERSAPEPAAHEHAATFGAATHAYGGLVRHYKLYVPARVAASPALVVMLHGCTQDPDDFALGTGVNRRADAEGFLVLYPQQSRADNPSACWNWFNRKDQQRDAGEPGLIADLVRTVAARHAVDPRRIHAAGLSAGGAMAAILASTDPDLFASVAVHSGLPAGAAGNVPDALRAMRDGRPSTRPARAASARGRAVPTVVFHGDADTTVHPANGDAVVRAVLDRSTQPPLAVVETASGDGSGNAARAGAFTCTRHLLDDGTPLVEHWVLHGTGHAWAGGDARGSHTDPRGIDATDRMLRFFDAQPR